jgi:hypothetical protein
VDADPLDNIGDLLFAVPQRFDDKTTRRISQGLEYIYLHHGAYVCL